jgi:hypothetical protein
VAYFAAWRIASISAQFERIGLRAGIITTVSFWKPAMSKPKRNSLIFLAVTAVLVLLLAMSLQSVSLAPGEPFRLADQTTGSSGGGGLDANVLGWVVRGALAVVVILMPVYIIYSLMSKDGRRRLLVNVILLAAFLFIADRLQKQMGDQDTDAQEMALGQPPDQMGDYQPPLAVFTPTPPPWLTVAVILAAAALLVLLALLALYIYRRRQQPEGDVHMEALAEAAQQTIETISSGGDLTTSVIACYREMSRVVQEQRGIARGETVTPREFEDVLIGRGLPGDAIRTLTRLFESVRYGSVPSGQREIDQAVAALTEIAQACRSVGSGRAYA